MTVARLYKRTVTQTTEQVNVERSQMNDTGHEREDSNKDKLVPTVIRSRGILTVARLYKRTVTQTTEQTNVERSQMNDTGHEREDSNKDKLVPTGKL